MVSNAPERSGIFEASTPYFRCGLSNPIIVIMFTLILPL
jgi:hypothetical protein